MPHQTCTSNPIQNNKENVNETQRVSSNEPYQATLDKLPRTALLCDEPSSFDSEDSKSKDFSDNKRRKPYIITKKIVYESCAIGCKWHMIYK